ncbi:MAG: hypothetical protein IT572_06030 [Deltaproteobacteria bacterium]|nr:hypothetical protein [Deltaproteobacteria bacterium]
MSYYFATQLRAGMEEAERRLAVDPVASMRAVENPRLEALAERVRDKLRKVVASLS